MTDKKNNPFLQEENLKVWLEKDKFYLASKKSSLQILRSEINFKPNLLMSVKNSYFNMIRLIAKNSAAAVLIATIALSTIGVSAAEIAAPTEYKPSTIVRTALNINQDKFKASKQNDRNPYSALIADNDNEVVSMPTCDLNIKYPRKFDDEEVMWMDGKMYLLKIGSTDQELINNSKNQKYIELISKAEFEKLGPAPELSENSDLKIIEPPKLEELEKNHSDKKDNHVIKILIECWDKNNDSEKYQQIMGQNTCTNKTSTDCDNHFTSKPMTVDQLRDLTGWFITDDISDISILEGNSDFDRDNIVKTYRIKFNYKNLSYHVEFSMLDNDLASKPKSSECVLFYCTFSKELRSDFLPKGLYGDQVQLQFRSLQNK